jgi:flagellar biosynthetic protein FliR
MMLQPGTIEAFALVLVRTSALVVSAPILGFGTGFGGYKIGLVFGLALVLYAAAGMPVEPELGVFPWGLCALREAVIGLFLGFLLHLVLLAVRVAGEMIGQEMGFMVAAQVDPVTGVQTPLVSTIYEGLFVLCFLALDGHHWVVRALAQSFERAPIGRLGFGTHASGVVTEMFAQMFQAGVVFAAPVLVFLLITSILIGLLARVVPQLNVMEVGFTLRVLVALGAMALFAPLLAPAMERLQRAFVGWLGRGLEALG